ncbi:unnamed protein product [Ambrosiozyma monospora]|uniref:Unnamed protein product n=1 Tax=Ambrosiozyma monospora TaxID=43982 RepID=A0ACB5T1T2_AMBMO|nr:unnamed protein product [Ambrosiozyma monospora]
MSEINAGFQKPDFKQAAQKFIHKVTTKDGFLGSYDYAALFTPKIPFMKQQHKMQPFFGLDADIPILLGFILGLQHALSMLAGLSTPPILLAGYVNLDDDLTQYMVSCSLIISGILSAVQITRFHIPFTPYYIGTGLISVVGTSFATISIAAKAFPMMYTTGKCATSADGTKLPCPDGFGAMLGTSACCALIEVLMSFMPPAILQKIFPPISLVVQAV